MSKPEVRTMMDEGSGVAASVGGVVCPPGTWSGVPGVYVPVLTIVGGVVTLEGGGNTAGGMICWGAGVGVGVGVGVCRSSSSWLRRAAN
jgi:hypothetical protein